MFFLLHFFNVFPIRVRAFRFISTLLCQLAHFSILPLCMFEYGFNFMPPSIFHLYFTHLNGTHICMHKWNFSNKNWNIYVCLSSPFFSVFLLFLFCPCLCSLALSLRCPCRPHCHLLQVSNAAEWPTMSPFCLSPPVSGLFLLFSSFSSTRPRFSLFLDSGANLAHFLI